MPELRKYHVPLYRVSEKAEVNIQAKTEKEALEKALEKKDELKYGPVGFKLMAQAFKVDKFDE